MPALIRTYFPAFTEAQHALFDRLGPLYEEWNARINVISRKDMEHFYEHHVLHSLAIHRFLPFQPGSVVMDIGTGGGFPGIPLAIAQPEVHFVLVDSIGKKIKVVNEVATALGLTNVSAIHGRAEEVKGSFDFVVSRAVAPLPDLLRWSNGKFRKDQRNALPNGLICLKGGDLKEETRGIRLPLEIHDLSEYFREDFFSTKKLVYVSV